MSRELGIEYDLSAVRQEECLGVEANLSVGVRWCSKDAWRQCDSFASRRCVETSWWSYPCDLVRRIEEGELKWYATHWKGG